jgi:hypothetical protein
MFGGGVEVDLPEDVFFSVETKKLWIFLEVRKNKVVVCALE